MANSYADAQIGATDELSCSTAARMPCIPMASSTPGLPAPSVSGSEITVRKRKFYSLTKKYPLAFPKMVELAKSMLQQDPTMMCERAKVEPQLKKLFCEDYDDREFTQSWFDRFKKYFNMERNKLHEMYQAEFALPVSYLKKQNLSKQQLSEEIKRIVAAVPQDIRNHPDIRGYESSDCEGENN